VLWLCRDLIRLRRAWLGGQAAGYQQVAAPAGLWAYRAGPLLVAVNLSGERAPCPRPAGPVLLTTAGPAAGAGAAGEGGLTLAPWEGVVAGQ
jgi:hypothetical protein